MYKTINAQSMQHPNHSLNVSVQLPIYCPTCVNSPQPTTLSAFFFDNGDYQLMYVLYFCTQCHKCFMAFYELEQTRSGSAFARLIQQYPSSTKKTAFSENICTLSPKFVEIYHQSELAEQRKLDEICGCGYRKALEFLVKDYAIKNNPDEEERIKKQFLSPCITEHISDEDIQTLAEKCAWLGNDEVHYVRKHIDKDLNDLKYLINAIITWLDFKAAVNMAKNIPPK